MRRRGVHPRPTTHRRAGARRITPACARLRPLRPTRWPRARRRRMAVALSARAVARGARRRAGGPHGVRTGRRDPALGRPGVVPPGRDRLQRADASTTPPGLRTRPRRASRGAVPAAGRHVAADDAAQRLCAPRTGASGPRTPAVDAASRGCARWSTRYPARSARPAAAAREVGASRWHRRCGAAPAATRSTSAVRAAGGSAARCDRRRRRGTATCCSSTPASPPAPATAPGASSSSGAP